MWLGQLPSEPEALFQNGDVESYFIGSSGLTADLIRPDRGDVEAVQ